MNNWTVVAAQIKKLPFEDAVERALELKIFKGVMNDPSQRPPRTWLRTEFGDIQFPYMPMADMSALMRKLRNKHFTDRVENLIGGRGSMNRLKEVLRTVESSKTEAAHPDIAKLISFASDAEKELVSLFSDVRSGLTGIDLVDDVKDISKAKSDIAAEVSATKAAIKSLSSKLTAVWGVLDRMGNTVKLIK